MGRLIFSMICMWASTKSRLVLGLACDFLICVMCRLFLNGNAPPEPPELVKGILHQSSKIVVGGTSKGRKTMTLIDLGVSVATGTPWWGFETVQGPVCYINFEIQEAFMCKRVAAVCKAKGVDLTKDQLMVWNLRGHGEGIENLVADLMAVPTASAVCAHHYRPDLQGAR